MNNPILSGGPPTTCSSPLSFLPVNKETTENSKIADVAQKSLTLTNTPSPQNDSSPAWANFVRLSSIALAKEIAQTIPQGIRDSSEEQTTFQGWKLYADRHILSLSKEETSYSIYINQNFRLSGEIIKYTSLTERGQPLTSLTDFQKVHKILLSILSPE